MTLRKVLALAAVAMMAVIPATACSSDSSEPADNKGAETSQDAQQPADDSADNSTDTATDAPSIPWGTHVDSATFKAAIDEGAEIIDVRTPNEFQHGHIAGATNMNLKSPDFSAKIRHLDPNKKYAVYCRSGGRSRAAQNMMLEAGIHDVVGLDGGINAWDGPTE